MSNNRRKVHLVDTGGKHSETEGKDYVPQKWVGGDGAK